MVRVDICDTYWVINRCCDSVRLFRWTIAQSRRSCKVVAWVAESECRNIGIWEFPLPIPWRDKPSCNQHESLPFHQHQIQIPHLTHCLILFQQHINCNLVFTIRINCYHIPLFLPLQPDINLHNLQYCPKTYVPWTHPPHLERWSIMDTRTILITQLMNTKKFTQWTQHSQVLPPSCCQIWCFDVLHDWFSPEARSSLWHSEDHHDRNHVPRWFRNQSWAQRWEWKSDTWHIKCLTWSWCVLRGTRMNFLFWPKNGLVLSPEKMEQQDL